MKLFIFSSVLAFSMISNAQNNGQVVYEAKCAIISNSVIDGAILISSYNIRENSFQGLVSSCKERSGTHLLKSYELGSMRNMNGTGSIGRRPGRGVVLSTERATVANSVRQIEAGDELVGSDGSLN